MPVDGGSPEAVSQRVGALVSAKADAQPCLLVTRAPLDAMLSTSRPADETITDGAGVRHDLIRVDERSVTGASRLPDVLTDVLGFSFEDAVY